jgi:hypothetical protein
MLIRLTTAAAALVFIAGCGETPTETESLADDLMPQMARGGGGIVHRASVGGADLCEALGLPTGCDANFSLTANQKADGSVKGQWQDTFTGGGEGIHVAIDCLNVVGNGAVIGGVITRGTAFGADVSGQRALTAVVDNGTSANEPADQISWSFFLEAPSCTDLVPADFPLFNLTHGQVKVY